MIADPALIGITPGEDFDPSTLALQELRAVNEGLIAASARVESFADNSH
jgi:hypothetical protein